MALLVLSGSGAGKSHLQDSVLALCPEEDVIKLTSLKKHVTCHVWRHTCASHLLQNQANLRHVQELLGHRSLATTERYLRLTITDLKAAHAKLHPREPQ